MAMELMDSFQELKHFFSKCMMLLANALNLVSTFCPISASMWMAGSRQR